MASNWIRSPGRSRLEPEADTGAAAGMPSERPQPLLLAAPLSLSGRYTLQGRLAAAGIEQVVEDVVGLGGLAVGGRRLMPVGAILDDESTRDGLRRALEVHTNQRDRAAEDERNRERLADHERRDGDADKREEERRVGDGRRGPAAAGGPLRGILSEPVRCLGP